jgi:hypothetical protein
MVEAPRTPPRPTPQPRQTFTITDNSLFGSDAADDDDTILAPSAQRALLPQFSPANIRTNPLFDNEQHNATLSAQHLPLSTSTPASSSSPPSPAAPQDTSAHLTALFKSTATWQPTSRYFVLSAHEGLMHMQDAMKAYKAKHATVLVAQS